MTQHGVTLVPSQLFLPLPVAQHVRRLPFAILILIALLSGNAHAGRTAQSFGLLMRGGKVVSPFPSNVAYGLFNPDLLPDIAVCDSGKVQVFQNLGNGFYTGKPIWEKPVKDEIAHMQWHKSRMLDEWLNDPMSWGDLILTYANGRSETISHLQMMPPALGFGHSPGPFLDPQLNFREVWGSEIQNQPSGQVAVGDIDRDGKIELCYCFYPIPGSGDTTVRLAIYQSIANDTYVVEWDTVLGRSGGTYGISDVDQNGKNELIFLHHQGVSLLEYSGSGHYKCYSTNITFPYTDRPGQGIYKIIETDIDHDGIRELTVLNTDSSVPYDNTLVFICEFVAKGSSNMAFDIQLVRADFSAYDLTVGQVDGSGWDEIVPGTGSFGVDEPTPIDYWWYSGIPGAFTWKVRGIQTGLASGSAAPLFTNLDADSTQELLIGGVGPIGFGSMFALDYIADTTWNVMWVDSTLRSGPLVANTGILRGVSVAAGSNAWWGPDTAYSELHVYQNSGWKVGTFRLESSAMQDFKLTDSDNDALTDLIFARVVGLPPYEHNLRVYEEDTTQTSVSGEDPNPGAFQVSQNYPNPFNSETTIRYRITESSHITIEIYNVIGQLVKRLVDQNTSAGEYSVLWNGTNEKGGDVGSGVYMYRVKVHGKAGLRAETKKMLLLR